MEPQHVGAQHLDEVTAERVDGVHAHRRQAQLQRGDQVLLEVRVQGADLLRVEFADKGDGLEVLEAQRWELQQFQRHQWHDDILLKEEIESLYSLLK